jgi:hypothetical protein
MDNGVNDSRTSHDRRIIKQEWQEEPWFSGIHILRDQEMSVLHTVGKASEARPSDLFEHRLSKDGAVEGFDMEGCNCGCNESTHPADSFKPLSIQQLSRPPMVRSYGSSSASSASTLMTPRDAHSWASSAHSPPYIETIDSIPTSSPYQLHILPPKFAKDSSFGDFPTSREFRFPSHAASTSPDSPELDWFLDDHTEAMTLPSYRKRTKPKRSKKTRMLGCNSRDAKQTQKAYRGKILPGFGIISPDGTYNEGITLLSNSNARHGPLTPEQRHGAAQMRRYGACRDCRKRKIKV